MRQNEVPVRDTGRRQRADGQLSRARILDATAEIAGERGFQGTSINLVSERSGLPASSIYWHFASKDELIAAVVDRSYRRWSDAMSRSGASTIDGASEPALGDVLRKVGETLDEFPDFLRLGLLLILDRMLDGVSSRAKFLDIRRDAVARARSLYRSMFADLDEGQVETLATLTLVLLDGTFVARDAGPLPPDAASELMMTALLGVVEHLRRGRPAPMPGARAPQNERSHRDGRS